MPDLIGWSPEDVVGFAAMYNGDEDHRLLANLCLRFAEKVVGGRDGSAQTVFPAVPLLGQLPEQTRPTRQAVRAAAQLLYEAAMVTADEVIERLGLLAHPEGGFYAETFRADALPFELPGQGARSASTAIYFLLKAQEFSALHVVSAADEVWHHYLGDALELHCFDASSGRHRELRLGADIAAGERPQHVVVRGELQAARVTPGPHGFALCGCTVAPGFDFADFRMPSRAELLTQLPEHVQLVMALTRG